MRLWRPRIPTAVLLWFGLFGAPFAWAVQLVVGHALTEAACSPAGRRWDIPLDAWTIVATTAGATVAALAGASAIATFRATRDVGGEPPGSRIRFLSVIGLTIAPLFLLIILMGGLGSIFLADCEQG